MKISVLDMGSTTFHLQVFEVDGNGNFRTNLSDRRALHLGRDVYSSGRIGEGIWEHAVTTVGELLDAAHAGPKDVTIAVATSVLRDASNGLAFRVELWKRYRLGVHLLTAEEEARFTYLGATTTPRVGGRRVAVIDLGGGSLEVAVGEGTRCLLAGSLPLGALAVRERLGHVGTLGPAELAHAYTSARAVGRNLFAEVRSLSPELIVFASGTARRTHEHLALRNRLPYGDGQIDSTTLRHAITAPQAAAQHDSTDRRSDDTLLAAAAIMLASLDLLHAERAIISNQGLRDGIALDMYRRIAHQSVGVPVRVWSRRLASLVGPESHRTRQPS